MSKKYYEVFTPKERKAMKRREVKSIMRKVMSRPVSRWDIAKERSIRLTRAAQSGARKAQGYARTTQKYARMAQKKARKYEGRMDRMDDFLGMPSMKASKKKKRRNQFSVSLPDI